MKSREYKIGRVVVAKLEEGDDIIDSVAEVAKKHDIKSGLVNVIGAFKKVTIGYFDLNTKEYTFKTYDIPVEMTTCMGSVAQKDGKPIVHLHITIGKEDHSLLGGHLGQPSIISVTGEVFIYEFEPAIQRATDPKWGLSLMDL